MKFTAQSDADRRNVTPITLKNGVFIHTNSAQNCIISKHVISVSYLHSFIESVLSQQYMESENVISTGNHGATCVLTHGITWSWL